jgi:hypothetical protein
MTLKEAVLKSLEDINDITNYLAVLNHINEKNYYDFGSAKHLARQFQQFLATLFVMATQE